MKTFLIYNGFSNTLLTKRDIAEGKTAIKAVKRFLTDKGIVFSKIKRSGGNNVKIMAQPIRIENEQMYSMGNKIWYEVS